MKRIVFYGLLALGVWWWWYDPPARWKGMPAAKDPVQTSANLPPAFAHERFTIMPLARYAITGVVLHRERYRFDAMAKICPLDLGLAWGPMSIAGVINELKITQRGRFLLYEYKSGEGPLEPEEINAHASNNHCLPANAAIRRKLLAVKRHELVSLEGYLVEVTGPENMRWRSSLTRDDTDGGACEIFWVTDVTRRRI
jgi:hypothetical protein